MFLRNLSILVLVIVVLFTSCENPDTSPPNVSLTFSPAGNMVSEIENISADISEDETVIEAYLFIDGSQLGEADATAPYSFQWNTIGYDDNSTHTIQIKAIDDSDNTGESELLTVTVDNSGDRPTAIDSIFLSIENGGLLVSWQPSPDSDFAEYILEKSLEASMSNAEEIFRSTEVTDNEYFDSDADPLVIQYYQITVIDIYDLSTSGLIISSSLNYEPAAVTLYPVSYVDGKFYLSWSASTEDDFVGYSVYEQELPAGSPNLIYETSDIADTTMIVDDAAGSSSAFHIVTTDTWGLNSSSNQEIGDGQIFSTTFGGVADDLAQSIQLTSDNSIFIAGYTESSGSGGKDAYALKTDGMGNLQWSQTYGISEDEVIRASVETSDGAWILCGYQSAGGERDAWLARISSTGSEIWVTQFGWAGRDEARAIALSADGGFIVAGHTDNFSGGDPDGWIFKIDAAGTKVWANDVHIGGTGWDELFSLIETSDGDIVACGNSNSYADGSRNAWVVKLGSDGSLLWNNTYGGNQADYAYDIAESSDGNLVFTGKSNSNSNGETDAWLVKIDQSGEVVWDKVYGGSFEEGTFSIVETSDAGFALCGYSYVNPGGGYEGWLVKTDGAGAKQWDSTIGGSSVDTFYDLNQLENGGFILTGYTYSSGAGGRDIWLVRTDLSGKTVDLSN